MSEVFSSIQGEGLLVGLRQIFVRFSGCSITCNFCDTPESRVQSPEFKIQGSGVSTLKGIKAQGSENQKIAIVPNPVTPARLTEIVNSFQTHQNLHHSISLTGGEPLEQVDFLKEWLQEIRGETGKRRQGEEEKKSADSPKIYLETNGLLPAHLSDVIHLVDMIGMDIKLPSVAGVKPFWNLHRDFLKIASEREVFVKVVVDSMASDDEVMLAAELVSSVDVNIPFIIQPRTPVDLDAGSLLRLQEIATRKLMEVRVIPQTHKFLKLK